MVSIDYGPWPEDPPPSASPPTTTTRKNSLKVLSAPKVTVAPDLLDGLLTSPWVGVTLLNTGDTPVNVTGGGVGRLLTQRVFAQFKI